MHHLARVLIALLSSSASWGATVILVRHAEVAGVPPDPSLSPQGQRRAKLLASMLKDAHIEAVYASEFRRTQQTAEPVAALFHIPVQKMTGADTHPLVEALRQLGSGTALVVGHSNTIPEIIAGLGGPKVEINDSEFDNFFVLTSNASGTSLLRLRYGSSSPSAPASGMRVGPMLEGRSPVMRVDFAKSGGFSGALKNVKGSITFQDREAEVSSGNEYRRRLAPDETDQLRPAVDPDELAKAAEQLKKRTAGSADLEHYQVTVTTADGKTRNIDFNTSGSSTELQGLPPAVVNFIRWLRQESKSILAHRAGAK